MHLKLRGFGTVESVYAGRDEPLHGVEQKKDQKDWGIKIEEKRQIANNLTNGECFEVSLGLQCAGNIECDAEPQQIESEKMKLTQAPETLVEIAESRAPVPRQTIYTLFPETMKAEQHKKRQCNRVDGDSAEKQKK